LNFKRGGGRKREFWKKEINNKEENRVYVQETTINEDSMMEIPTNPGLAQYSRNRPQVNLDSSF